MRETSLMKAVMKKSRIGRKETISLQSEIGSSAWFLFGARTHFERVVRFDSRQLF